MALSDERVLGPFFYGEDATFTGYPEVVGVINLAATKCDLLSWDGTTVIKSLTPGSGITVNGTASITCTWATDELDANSRPKFPPGRYQFQVWTTTVGQRHPVGFGPFEVQTKDF